MSSVPASSTTDTRAASGAGSARSTPGDAEPGNRCPNCGAAVSEAYCAHCGQKYHEERFTLWTVLRTSLAEAVELENGFLATLLGLSHRPGQVIRDYWRRCTKPYMNPVKYVLFALTVLQIVFWQTGALGDAVSGLVSGFENAPRSPTGLSRADVIRTFSDYFVAFFAAGIPVQSALVQWGNPRSYAEHLIFNLFVGGQLALVWSVLLPVAFLLPVAKTGYALLPITAGYYIWAYATAHGPDTDSRWTPVAAAVLTLVCAVFVYTMILGFSIGMYEAAVLR
jgi:hypothetical protein